VRLFSLLVSAVAVTVLFCSPAQAGQDVEQDRRYDSFKINGQMHRMDLITGKVQKLSQLPNGALQWVPVDVQTSDAPPISTPAVGSAAPNELPSATQLKLPAPPNTQKFENAANTGRRAPTIEIEDENGNVISDSISPDDRKAAIPLISTYENKVSLSHTVQIGDKITGNILIKNTGDRRLKMLELTMYVPIIGRDKPEEHHFIFIDKPGSTTPPQPGSNGRDPIALLQKVDIPCPSGGVKGSPELKISFIRFE